MAVSDYLGKKVPKPWGYEYLCFENHRVAIWCLHLQKGRETSFHCHPNKSTGLLLLGGESEVVLAKSSYKMRPGSKINIFPRRFHKTKAITDSILFEVETPVNKSDLVRLYDSNGREDDSYESYSSDSKETICFNEINKRAQLGECEVAFCPVKTFDDFNDLDKGVAVFLTGGVVHSTGQKIIEVGEFFDFQVLSSYRDKFQIENGSTVIKVQEISKVENCLL